MLLWMQNVGGVYYNKDKVIVKIKSIFKHLTLLFFNSSFKRNKVWKNKDNKINKINDITMIFIQAGIYN